MSDEKLSGSKIQPLDSATKYGEGHDRGSGGVAGSDHSIDQSRIDPIGGRGVGQHTEQHADSQGVIGRDETVQGAKIDPLNPDAKDDQGRRDTLGLDDEQIDTTRIDPVGSVRD